MHCLLIRHARPFIVEHSEGPADPELSEEGARQAIALANHLTADRIDAIYASPMTRAQQTAEPLSLDHALPILTLDDLAEFDQDSSTYLPLEELKRANDGHYQALLAGDFSHFGVDMNVFRRRVASAIDQIVDGHPGEIVAIVCHGGVINAAIGALLGLDSPYFFSPEYTSISRIAAGRHGRRSLISLNETHHLGVRGQARRSPK